MCQNLIIWFRKRLKCEGVWFEKHYWSLQCGVCVLRLRFGKSSVLEKLFLKEWRTFIIFECLCVFLRHSEVRLCWMFRRTRWLVEMWWRCSGGGALQCLGWVLLTAGTRVAFLMWMFSCTLTLSRLFHSFFLYLRVLNLILTPSSPHIYTY